MDAAGPQTPASRTAAAMLSTEPASSAVRSQDNGPRSAKPSAAKARQTTTPATTRAALSRASARRGAGQRTPPLSRSAEATDRNARRVKEGWQSGDITWACFRACAARGSEWLQHGDAPCRPVAAESVKKASGSSVGRPSASSRASAGAADAPSTGIGCVNHRAMGWKGAAEGSRREGEAAARRAKHQLLRSRSMLVRGTPGGEGMACHDDGHFREHELNAQRPQLPAVQGAAEYSDTATERPGPKCRGGCCRKPRRPSGWPMARACYMQEPPSAGSLSRVCPGGDPGRRQGGLPAGAGGG